MSCSNDFSSSTSNVNEDSDYIPNTDTETSCQNVSCASLKVSKGSMMDVSNTAPIDIRKLKIPFSHSDERSTKKNFCYYCKSLQTKLARHLEKKHKDEEKVKGFLRLPKGSLIRKKKICEIQRAGNSLHNSDPNLNTGILITCRRKQTTSVNTPADYLTCTICRGYFSKRTLRIHYKKCNLEHRKGVREITVPSRSKLGYIHDRASDVLRRVVFPVMKEDDIKQCIRYDELIVLAGNKFCDKYTHTHQHDLVRSNLRLLGRFKQAIMNKNQLQELSSVFQPQFYDTAVEAVRICAGFNPTSQLFEHPSVATTLGTLLKKCANIWKSECIKKLDTPGKEAAQEFLDLYNVDYPTTINRKVMEDQIKQKRSKKVILPLKSDIQKLYSFLNTTAESAMRNLLKNFEFTSWKSLSESCLLMVQIFNRRRAGEIERLLITDFENKESIDSVNSDLYSHLSKESQEYAKKYVRLTIRGKLGRTVPVLLDTKMVNWIDTILRYRSEAGLSRDNEYVFGVPHTNNLAKKYLRACPLMRKFSEECKAVMPTTLRGTNLRKHIATYTAMLNIEENQVSQLANFMGHNKQIHKDIYRVPGPVKDVTDVSKLLQSAMGNDENESSDSEEEDIPNTYNSFEMLVGQRSSASDSSRHTNSIGNRSSEYLYVFIYFLLNWQFYSKI